MTIWSTLLKYLLSVSSKISWRLGSTLSQFPLLLHHVINASTLVMSAAELYPRHAGEQYVILARDAVCIKTS